MFECLMNSPIVKTHEAFYMAVLVMLPSLVQEKLNLLLTFVAACNIAVWWNLTGNDPCIEMDWYVSILHVKFLTHTIQW